MKDGLASLNTGVVFKKERAANFKRKKQKII
jgi:hypothetical protein